MADDSTCDVGDVLPDVRLPGTGTTGVELYRISEFADGGLAVLCVTSSWEHSRRVSAIDLPWFDVSEKIGAGIVVTEGELRHTRTLAAELGVPVVVDINDRVARSCGVGPSGEREIVLLIDDDRRILCATTADSDGIDLQPIDRTLKRQRNQ